MSDRIELIQNCFQCLIVARNRPTLVSCCRKEENAGGSDKNAAAIQSNSVATAADDSEMRTILNEIAFQLGQTLDEQCPPQHC